MKYLFGVLCFVGILINPADSSIDLFTNKVSSENKPCFKYVVSLARSLEEEMLVSNPPSKPRSNIFFAFLKPKTVDNAEDPTAKEIKRCFENLKQLVSRPIDCLGKGELPGDTCFGTIENYEKQLEFVLDDIDAIGIESLQVRNDMETLRFRQMIRDANKFNVWKTVARVRTREDDEVRQVYTALIKAIGEIGNASIILNQADDMSPLTKALIDLRKKYFCAEGRSAVEKAKVITSVLGLGQTELEEIFRKRSTLKLGKTTSSAEAFIGENDASESLRYSQIFLKRLNELMASI